MIDRLPCGWQGVPSHPTWAGGWHGPVLVWRPRIVEMGSQDIAITVLLTLPRLVDRCLCLGALKLCQALPWCEVMASTEQVSCHTVHDPAFWRQPQQSPQALGNVMAGADASAHFRMSPPRRKGLLIVAIETRQVPNLRSKLPRHGGEDPRTFLVRAASERFAGKSSGRGTQVEGFQQAWGDPTCEPSFRAAEPQSRKDKGR